MTARYRLAALALAPLALALSACDDSDAGEEAAVIDGEPLAAVEAPDGAQWDEIVTVTEADGYLLGNPDAPIKLVEYASLTCPACAQFAAQGAEELKSEYVNSGRVSFELRNQIHGSDDLILARLVRCGQPEAFHPLADRVWAGMGELRENFGARGAELEAAIDRRDFVGFAETAGWLDYFAQAGVSRDQARACLADSASLERIATNSAEQSDELGIGGTPTFLINGRIVDAQTWPQLEPLLQQAGAR